MILTIDEAIQHCKEVIEDNEINIENQNPLFPNTIEECKECIEAHKQLMNWLEELRNYERELYKTLKDEYYTFERLNVTTIDEKPYYSIVYTKNGDEYEGCYTFSLDVISNFLKWHFENHGIKPISYFDCADVVLKMWMDNVLTDGEYNKIMDKLNKFHNGENYNE